MQQRKGYDTKLVDIGFDDSKNYHSFAVNGDGKVTAEEYKEKDTIEK